MLSPLGIGGKIRGKKVREMKVFSIAYIINSLIKISCHRIRPKTIERKTS